MPKDMNKARDVFNSADSERMRRHTFGPCTPRQTSFHNMQPVMNINPVDIERLPVLNINQVDLEDTDMFTANQDLLVTLAQEGTNLYNDVTNEFAHQSGETQSFPENYNPGGETQSFPENYNPGGETQSFPENYNPNGGGSKRVRSDSEQDSEDSSKGKKHVNRSKIRQRYKKVAIPNSTTLQKSYNLHVSVNAPPKEIAQYFGKDFSACEDKFASDNSMTASRFCNHMSETAYYMFVVKRGNNKPFEVVFAKLVNSVTNEYQNNYHTVDNRVFVVSINNFKFMVSYNLVRELEIEIPAHVNLCSDEEAKCNPYDCHFEPVKNSFETTLITHFHLDMYYCQTTLMTLLHSVGENKTNLLMDRVYQMHKSRLLYTLPIVTSLKQPAIEITPRSKKYASSYVTQILNYSKNLRFPEHKYNGEYTNTLDQHITQKTKLTYKYSSVAELFFTPFGKRNDNSADSLKKVKKEDGNRLLVEQYLSRNEHDENSHNFIVLQFGGANLNNDERLTIVKKGREFYWVAGEVKDINVDEHVKKYPQNTHHVFRIINSNRRETTTWHNNLLKMLAMLLQNLITIYDVEQYSNKIDKFSYKRI
uniref:Immediate early protein 1 n=1 Tax=Antheraea pernyi nuclear polyhedrosis virus TaxID=161494 RepID=A0A1V1FM88_NPVAP|nr:immediate early protein 1 [Antheraea pernyi nucleopolyhedrovirus]BCX55472.1 immediate early protein 1 [Antheraea pernyi nucleopolyhedrovirus]